METAFSAAVGNRPTPAPLRGPAAMTDEGAWLAAARQGEPWALEQFYQLYQPQVYSLCYRLLGRAEDAEDAVQATFVRAFRSLPKFRGDSAPRTWLFRIATNEALGLLRQRRPAPEWVEERHAVPDSTGRVVERLAVQAALARLRPDHRAILVLRLWEGLSYNEIAAVLGISLPAVKMRLNRAREQFRRFYEEMS